MQAASLRSSSVRAMLSALAASGQVFNTTHWSLHMERWIVAKRQATVAREASLEFTD